MSAMAWYSLFALKVLLNTNQPVIIMGLHNALGEWRLSKCRWYDDMIWQCSAYGNQVVPSLYADWRTGHITNASLLDWSNCCDDLHWLPVCQSIKFKLCSLVNKFQRRRTWPTCASQCRRHPVALICVLPFTATSSFHRLAWPAMGLAVSPSRVHWPGTVCRLISATRLCLLRVS